jgi:hypothetical protein
LTTGGEGIAAVEDATAGGTVETAGGGEAAAVVAEDDGNTAVEAVAAAEEAVVEVVAVVADVVVPGGLQTGLAFPGQGRRGSTRVPAGGPARCWKLLGAHSACSGASHSYHLQTRSRLALVMLHIFLTAKKRQKHVSHVILDL